MLNVKCSLIILMVAISNVSIAGVVWPKQEVLVSLADKKASGSLKDAAKSTDDN